VFFDLVLIDIPFSKNMTIRMCLIKIFIRHTEWERLLQNGVADLDDG